MMEVLHQVTPQLNSCIDLNLGKMLKPRLFEKPHELEFNRQRMPKGLLKIKELLIQEDFLLMVNNKPLIKFFIQAATGHEDIYLQKVVKKLKRIRDYI